MPESSVTVRVTPRAAKNDVVRVGDDSLIVKTTIAPVDGAANKAVIKMLSEALDCPKSSLRIKSGETSRDKGFVIEGVGQEELRRRIRQIKPKKEPSYS